jgi:hypothetical protein
VIFHIDRNFLRPALADGLFDDMECGVDPGRQPGGCNDLSGIDEALSASSNFPSD